MRIDRLRTRRRAAGFHCLGRALCCPSWCLCAFVLSRPIVSHLLCPWHPECRAGASPGRLHCVVHFGLTAKYQLTAALARLRERGDPIAGGRVGDSLILHEANNPSPPASPYPLPPERAVINCGPAVNPCRNSGYLVAHLIV